MTREMAIGEEEAVRDPAHLPVADANLLRREVLSGGPSSKNPAGVGPPEVVLMEFSEGR